VRSGSAELLANLAGRSDVARITANHKYQLQEPFINTNPPAKVDAVEPKHHLCQGSRCLGDGLYRARAR